MFLDSSLSHTPGQVVKLLDKMEVLEFESNRLEMDKVEVLESEANRLEMDMVEVLESEASRLESVASVVLSEESQHAGIEWHSFRGQMLHLSPLG